MLFSPITSSLRFVLPKQEVLKVDRRSGAYPTKSRTGDRTRTGRNNVYFDDTRTVVFATGVNVSYPTTFPTGAAVLQPTSDLTSSLVAIGNVVPKNVGQWVPHREQVETLGPFVDCNLPEQNETNVVNSAMMTGSAFFVARDRFKSKVSNKTIVRLEFPLKAASTLSPNSSSNYYLNASSGVFDVVKLESAVATSMIPTVANPSILSPRFDPILFTPYGYLYSIVNQNISGLGGGFGAGPILPATLLQNINNYVPNGFEQYISTVSNTSLYTGSLLNPDHAATANQLLKLSGSLSAPFLLEKVVIEFPFQAGKGWLNDRFQHTFFGGTGSFRPLMDVGGPMISVALLRQDKAENRTRELICSAAFTTALDALTSTFLVTTSSISANSLVSISPAGVGAIVNCSFVSGTVMSGATNTYTGSISLTMSPCVTHHASRYRSSGSPSFMFTDTTQTGADAPTSVVTSFGSISKRFGSFVSERSVFGNHLSPMVNDLVDDVKNPCRFLDNVSFVGLNNREVVGGGTSILKGKFAWDVVSTTRPSPYLLYPQDELILCLSKHRPVAANNQITTNSIDPLVSSHDAVVPPGSVRITLYGDLVREDAEFHDTLNQRLETNEIWEEVGREPVLDQFDVSRVTDLSGSYLDAFSVDKEFTVSRSELSSSNETTQLYSNFSSQALTNTPMSTQFAWSKAKKAFELQSNSRFLLIRSDNELLWDCRVPNPRQALNVVNPNVKIVANDAANSTYSNVIYSGLTQSLQSGFSPDPGHGAGDWFMSYPFEPRFSDVATQFELGVDSWNVGFRKSARNGSQFNYADLVLELGDPSNRQLMVADFTGDGNNPRSLPRSEFVKYFYGIGDGRSLVDNNYVEGVLSGTTGTLTSFAASSGARIRGWRYGMANGFKTYSKLVYRRDRFGQVRDMLEQRLDTKYFNEANSNPLSTQTVAQGVLEGPIQVRFHDQAGSPSDPTRTLSSNLSTEATSSFPYIDGVSTNRGPIDAAEVNVSRVTF